MNGVKLQWYRFVDTYDMFHKHGFRSGHNFVIHVNKEQKENLLARMATIAPSLKLYSQQPDYDGNTLYVAVDNDAEAVALKLGIV